MKLDLDTKEAILIVLGCALIAWRILDAVMTAKEEDDETERTRKH